MQEADDGGPGLAAVGGVPDAGHRAAHVSIPKGPEDRAVEGHPLVHLDDLMARHQRRRLEPADIVEDRSVRARDLERVAEAAGRDHPDGGPLSLQDRVGADGGAVNHPAGIRQHDLELRERVEQAHRRVGGTGRRLSHLERAGGLVIDHDVGKGPAHVHANPAHQLLPLLPTAGLG